MDGSQGRGATRYGQAGSPYYLVLLRCDTRRRTATAPPANRKAERSMKMSKITHRYLTMLHDNMTRGMEGSEHTKDSRAAERRLFEEASRIIGSPVTGYTHGECPLDLVFQAAHDRLNA